jgi:hypothetical protein
MGNNVYFKTRDPIAIAAAGVFMGLVAGLIFGQTLEGVSGVMLWACVGLLLDAPISRKLRVTYNRFPNSGLAERIS